MRHTNWHENCFLIEVRINDKGGNFMLDKEQVNMLQSFAKQIRIKTIHQMKVRGFGHIGGAMSIVDVSVWKTAEIRSEKSCHGGQRLDCLLKRTCRTGYLCGIGFEGIFPDGMAGYPESAGNQSSQSLRQKKDAGN